MNIEMADRLVELRRRANLSQEMLAEKVDVSRQAISKWERGEACPETDKLILLSELYGVSLDVLLRGKEWENEEVEKNTNCKDTIKNTECIEGEGMEKPLTPQGGAVPPPMQPPRKKRKMGAAWLLEYPLTNLGISLLFVILMSMVMLVVTGDAPWMWSSFSAVNMTFGFGNVLACVYLLPWFFRVIRCLTRREPIYDEQDSTVGKFFQVFPYPFFILLVHLFALCAGRMTGWWLLYLTIPLYEWGVQSLFKRPTSWYQVAMSFPVMSSVLFWCCFLSIGFGRFLPYLLLVCVPVYYLAVIGIHSIHKKKDKLHITPTSIK